MKYIFIIICLFMVSCTNTINNKPTPECINTCLELKNKRKSLAIEREWYYQYTRQSWTTQRMEEMRIERLDFKLHILETRVDIDSLMRDSMIICK